MISLRAIVKAFAAHVKHDLTVTVRNNEMDMHCLTCGWLLFTIPVRRRKR